MTSKEDDEEEDLEVLLFLKKSEIIYVLVMLQRIEVGPNETFDWELYRTATRDELAVKLQSKIQELGGMNGSSH